MNIKPEVAEMLRISTEHIIYSGKVKNNSRAQVIKPSKTVSERFLAVSAW